MHITPCYQWIEEDRPLARGTGHMHSPLHRGHTKTEGNRARLLGYHFLQRILTSDSAMGTKMPNRPRSVLLSVRGTKVVCWQERKRTGYTCNQKPNFCVYFSGLLFSYDGY